MNLSNFAKDLLERAGWTFLQGTFAVLSVAALTTAVSDLDYLGAWNLLWAALVGGGLAALLSMVKSAIAGQIGEETAQLGVTTYTE